uniref:Type I cytokine receptor cytokine-binding domain-containing protein n=1 Tax=Amphiprion percula TaxID=161767 RepID=A0A3P8TK81_AMPPE
MTGMFRSLDLLVLSCLFITVISETGKISPPQNFTLRWIDDFTPELSWIPQDSVRNCNYTVTIIPQEGAPNRVTVFTSKWSDFTILGGRSLNFSVTTDCSDDSSEPAVHSICYSELVKQLDCYNYAPGKTHCQWNPASDAPDLQFFYKLINQVGSSSDESSELQECPSYSYSTTGVRTGCELQASERHEINILFNGTVNDKPARNTFIKLLKDHVRPPALKWTVVKSKDAFSISWIAPDIFQPSNWKYNLRYTVCNKTACNKPEILGLPKEEKTSYRLERDSQWQYCIAIQAVVETGGNGATPWSADQCFEEDLDALVFVAFIIPCVVAILAALMFVCCRRNKDKFFPRIITPVDFITDIDNNNKSNLYNLQAPAEEEQTCEITVLDPEIIRLDC